LTILKEDILVTPTKGSEREVREAARQHELFVGDVFNAAIQKGLKVEGVIISDKPYLDIGTGDDLRKAVKRCIAQVD
jgi:dTDP-glucose pyrophosphorylase